jgi:elongation factor P hydroxylase
VLHNYQDLITIFNDCFALTYNTRLLKGNEEPIYLPAELDRPYHAIFFAHGFFSSALHECAHWFVAGSERRKQVDYGYWYIPDGRTSLQQQRFEQVEVKPQALEWILSQAAGYRFHLSIDNLNGEIDNTEGFKLAIYQQIEFYCANGLPKRIKLFREALCRFYNSPSAISIRQFDLKTLNTFS